MSTTHTFDKYDLSGAYHWRECDRLSSAYNPALVARYAMLLSRIEGDTALDLGAGDGYLTARLAERCTHVLGIESEEAGVTIANRMLKDIANARVEKGDCYALPFGDNSFDVVVMADVIEHLEAPEKAVAEMARVARRGAATYVTTPQWRSDRVWDHRHVKEFRAEELESLMRTAFGRVEMVYAWPRRWSDLYRTRLGWRGLRMLGRIGINPFRAESATPEGFSQMLAIGRDPKGA